MAGGSGLMSAWVQAEKMMQIILVLPSAAFIGWVLGYLLDRWLHQTWISMAGIIFGVFAGLVGAVRMAVTYGKASGSVDEGKSGSSQQDRDA